MMKDELLDIAEKLLGYKDEGWRIVEARRLETGNGTWSLLIEKVTETPETTPEAANESNE